MEKIKKFSKIIKINNTLLALPFAYIGVLFAGGDDSYTWILVTVAMISAGTVGVIANNLIDSDKTQTRKSSASHGKLSKNILLTIVILSALVFLYASYILNELCFYFSIAGLFMLITYSYLKRFTWATHFYLGLLRAAAPIGGYIAETGRFEPAAFILGGAILLWVSGLDIFYSIRNMDSDTRKNLFSIPVRFGYENALSAATFLYLLAAVTLIATGLITSRGLPYWTAVSCTGIIFIKQHLLARNRDIQASMIEFFQIDNFIAPVLFVGTFIDVIFK